MMKPKPQLIVALDVDTLEKAKRLIDVLAGDVEIFKVGSQLFSACGPEAVRCLLAKDKKVFLDLKYHDIPNAVAGAVGSAAGLREKGRGIYMCTLHTAGGREMLTRAVIAAKAVQNTGVKRPLLVGITVLTSEEKRDNIHELVLERAVLAKESGLDGVVASSQEAAMIRKELGEEFIIVTPGIRPAGAQAGDQKRVATPRQAVIEGSDFLVVGRPILESQDPLAVARQVRDEIQSAL